MSSSCGCSDDTPTTEAADTPPPRLWRVRRLQLADLSGGLLLLAWVDGEGAPGSS